jgi:hypothetical protein
MKAENKFGFPVQGTLADWVAAHASIKRLIDVLNVMERGFPYTPDISSIYLMLQRQGQLRPRSELTSNSTRILIVVVALGFGHR